MATDPIYGELIYPRAAEQLSGNLSPKQGVLVLADDASFARDIAGRCQIERNLPAFTVLTSDSYVGGTNASFDVAIIGPVHHVSLDSLLRNFELQGVPVVCVVDDSHTLNELRHHHPRTASLRKHDGWLDSTVLICNEVLRRVELQKRVKRLEMTVAAETTQAALGRYMLEARHQFANALTGVLGNAELLQLNELLTKPMREQVDTIHSMALKLHEMMHRFSSLATEMSFHEKRSHSETNSSSHSS